MDGFRSGCAAEASVVGAHCPEVPAKGDRRRQVDGVEGPELGRLECSRLAHDVRVEVDESESREDRSRSSDGSTAKPSRHPLDLDTGHNA